MKVDMTRDITNLQGASFKTGGIPCPECGNLSGETETLTLRRAIVQALTSFTRDDREGEEKFKRYKLALTITDEDTPDLTPENLVLIRKLIGRIYAPVVVGRCWEMLE